MVIPESSCRTSPRAIGNPTPIRRRSAYVGMSRFLDVAEVGPLTLPVRESLLILEGAARIEIEGGPTLELKVGDMASIPEAATVTFHLTLPFKEVWLFGRAYEVTVE